MNPFFSYILLGLSLSAPIGPINAAQLNKGIQYSFLHAWLVGMGAMVADGLFMVLIYFGIAQFLTTPFMKTFLFLFGFFVLTYTGIESMITSKKRMEVRSAPSETLGKSFRTGFFMAVSNPLNILFWLGIYGSVLAQASSQYKPMQMILYTGAIFVGIFLWDIIMATIASSFKKMLHSKLLQWVSMGAGLSLIGFGLYFGYKALLLFGW
ncbi:LysE family transporter [Hazenella sp. IB182357]|uniref:LysE family transporter n=1 Tax=Polycladospora coralii TaxID=2771432 RepID=A0A926N7L1_9BACL|nr:LysE family transporter [Polycladospora coralii]MBD1371122.1 LysE family transporter [Polycladospora coralii]MBS7530064.1 LysE family transporter [Polycladospora coralii]